MPNEPTKTKTPSKPSGFSCINEKLVDRVLFFFFLSNRSQRDPRFGVYELLVMMYFFTPANITNQTAKACCVRVIFIIRIRIENNVARLFFN